MLPELPVWILISTGHQQSGLLLMYRIWPLGFKKEKDPWDWLFLSWCGCVGVSEVAQALTDWGCPHQPPWELPNLLCWSFCMLKLCALMLLNKQIHISVLFFKSGFFEVWRDVAGGEEVIYFLLYATSAWSLLQQILLLVFPSLPCDATTELSYLCFNVGWLVSSICVPSVCCKRKRSS